jgi:hypothetical protein
MMPVLDRPQSLKDTLQVLLPIRLLTSALRESSLATEGQEPQLELLRGITSRNFNRLVWGQISQIPESAYSVLPHLDMPLASITETSTGQTVLLGDERFGAKIELVREGELLMIDRVWLLAGQADPPELRHSLQMQLAKRGPRGFAADPLSGHPISTDPSRTASSASVDSAPAELPEMDASARQVPSSAILPTITEAPKRAALAQPANVR